MADRDRTIPVQHSNPRLLDKVIGLKPREAPARDRAQPSVLLILRQAGKGFSFRLMQTGCHQACRKSDAASLTERTIGHYSDWSKVSFAARLGHGFGSAFRAECSPRADGAWRLY